MVNSLVGGAIGGATVTIVIKALDDYSKTINDVQKKTSTLGKEMMGYGTALAGAGIAGAVALGSFAKEAAIAGDQQEAFNKIVGKDGPEALAKMQKATLGTVDKWSLMSAASVAVTKGIRVDAIPIFTEYAQRLADADPQFSNITATLDSISTAIATGRQITLNSMGIQIDANAVYAEFAKKLVQEKVALMGLKPSQETFNQLVAEQVKQLTDAEKRTAFQNAALDQMTKKMEGMAKPTVDAADQIQQLGVQFKELKVSLGQAVAPALEVVIGIIQRLIGWFNGLSDSQKKVIGVAALLVSGLLILSGGILIVAGAVTVLTAVSSPWLIIILAIIAAIGAIIAVIIYWNDIMTFLKDKVLVPIWEFLQSKFGPQIEALKELIRILGLAFNWFKDEVLIPVWNILKDMWGWISDNLIPILTKVIDLFGKVGSFVGKTISLPKQVADIASNAFTSQTKKVGDAIIRPNGQVIETDPNDTLFATKNGFGGITVNIESIYGMDPKEVSRALKEELATKISI